MRRDPDRMRPFLRQRRVIDDKDCAGAADQLVSLDREFLFQQRLVPHAARNEMMQLVVVARRPSRRNRLDALALARPNQPSNVERTHPSARLVSEPRQERRKPSLQIPAPLRDAAGPAKSQGQGSTEFPYKPLFCQSSVSSDRLSASASALAAGRSRRPAARASRRASRLGGRPARSRHSCSSFAAGRGSAATASANRAKPRCRR